MAFDQKITKQVSNFKRVKFFTYTDGDDFIRILGDEHIADTHYINERVVKCLGKDCPICADNRELWKEFGKEANKQKGYSAKSTKVYFNVMDRTVAKVCPNAECGVDIKKVDDKFPTACPKCNTMLVSVQPAKLNQIRAMQVNTEVFNDIVDKNATVLDEHGTPIGIYNFDLKVASVGKGKERRSKIRLPETLNTEEVKYNKEDLFDLSQCYITLTADEIKQVRRGVQFKDIFAARKPNTVVTAPVDPDLTEDIKAMESAISDMLA